MKKILKIIICFVIIFLLVGCEDKEIEVESGNTSSYKIIDDNFNRNGSGTLVCMTPAFISDGVDVEVKNIISYKNGVITMIKSYNKVTTDDQSILDTYYDAYSKIKSNYVGLKYYGTDLHRDSNYVSYNTVIDYKNIDIDKLLDIEGAEDNVVEKGEAKLSLWLDLASRIGTTCNEE